MTFVYEGGISDHLDLRVPSRPINEKKPSKRHFVNLELSRIKVV